MWWRTSNCSPLLIYRPEEDERLSWPGWLTSSGRLTHISGHPSATGRAQDGERTLARDWRSTTEPRGPTVIDKEQHRPTRWIKEAVHICKEGHRAMNGYEVSYQLSHAYDRLLDATGDRRIKTQKNWVPASSDEDLVTWSKRQNKVLKFWLWYMNSLLRKTKLCWDRILRLTKPCRRQSWLVANSVHTSNTDRTRQSFLVRVGGVNWH